MTLCIGFDNPFLSHISTNKLARLSTPSYLNVHFTFVFFKGTIPATPENITVTFLTPSTVRVSWQTMIDLNAHPVEKYIVTYKPSDDRYVKLFMNLISILIYAEKLRSSEALQEDEVQVRA